MYSHHSLFAASFLAISQIRGIVLKTKICVRPFSGQERRICQTVQTGVGVRPQVFQQLRGTRRASCWHRDISAKKREKVQILKCYFRVFSLFGGHWSENLAKSES